MPRSLAHVITGLETGGAETMLLTLLGESDRARWSSAVISLQDRGTLGDEIEQLGIPVDTVGLKCQLPGPAAVWRLMRALRKRAPDVLVGWMYHGNMAAFLGRSVLGRRVPVLWDIQYTPEDLATEKWSTAGLIRLGARLSPYVSRIIYNSRVSASRHAELGYAAEQAIVIPNGFDTNTFVPQPEARTTWRTRLGLSADHIVIGRVGRYHAQKDYPGFLVAASQLLRDRPSVHFVLAGRGVEASNRELMNLVASAGLRNAVSLLGEVRPPHELTAAFDIACSPSAYGEAFPGVLAEAMSCGVPCVSTDVGDSAWIIGDVGQVVPPRDPEAFAAAMRLLVDAGPEQRNELGARARKRIRDHFSIQQVATRYEAVFGEVAA